MPLPYSVLGNITGSISSASYLSAQDTSLFLASQSVDFFFGYSDRDVVEFSIFDTSNNQISWSVLHQTKSFESTTLSFLDALNNPQSYTFSELNPDFLIYKSQDILLDMLSELSQSSVMGGSFNVSQIFTRQMSGNPDIPLVVNDISPSRTEIKILPSSQDVESMAVYTAFLLKKFVVSDVSPILLSLVQACPYNQIYNKIQPLYSDSIQFLQSIFFLPDNASVINFLKNIYEDLVKYTILNQNQINAGISPTQISRIQGIRSYFNNYLLQNNGTISDFNDIEQQFDLFTKLRVAQAFNQYANQTGSNYLAAQQFCIDFFNTYFYAEAVHPIQRAYEDKYFSYFKNVLNFGNNAYFPILNHTYLDERQQVSDPLTLVIKLGSQIPSNFSIKDLCWISNFGMTPFVETIVLTNPNLFPTYKIGPPDFGNTNKFITKENVNKLYSSDDLTFVDNTQNEIDVNKLIAELNTDYSDFNNFIVFSSAVARLNIFKNKIISYYNLSSSFATVTQNYLNSLSSSIVYPYYTNEINNFQTQIDQLVSSFDAYESYLFNQGNYVYSVTSSSFINHIVVSNNDVSASTYDLYNRDSLINNTPDYLVSDTNNQDYLTFLAMVGHQFDNIYTYVSALPVEKQIKNQVISSLPMGTLKEVLYSFGWNIDDIIGDLDVDEVYLNSLNSPIYNLLSAQERLKTIWNRILVSLPGIYKTKGTAECVNYLMSAYGLPSSLITIREYGGTDFSVDTGPTYQLDEKTYMLVFSGVNDYIEGPIPSLMNTVEFKFAVENPNNYQDYQRISLFTVYPYGSSNAAWSIDFYKVPGQFTGKIAFQMRGGSTGASIVSDTLPIFNGDIFSVMLRRNDVDPLFEVNDNPNAVPLEYDLIIQRNESGRTIFSSSTSTYLYTQDNTAFSQFGRFRLSDGKFIGTLDKLSIWNVPIDDLDFQEHVNDLNSYGYSGSNAFSNLIVRLSWDYPENVSTGSPSAMWLDNKSQYYFIPNYHSSTYISSSIVPSEYSASQKAIQTLWNPIYPTGSTDIIAWNFLPVTDPNWSASFNCGWISSSIYPFSFRELQYEQDIDASKFGPSKFKNIKIRELNYDVEARFDSNARSTFDDNVTISGESNQLGFFIDPQDSKNKDILRYIGKNGIMDLIGDPRNKYNSKYPDLINKNYEYNSFGNKKTLFNELLTVYKFYFDKSIFSAIKNVMPARANLFTGVVIEPTILERPKYPNKPINSSATPTWQNPAVINNIYTFDQDILWANFETSSLSIGHRTALDLTDVNNGKIEYDKNLNRGYVTDFMDNIQFGVYPDLENLQRIWAIPGLEPSNPTNYNYSYPIGGSVSRDNRVGKFNILPDPGSSDPSNYWVGLNQNSHSAVYYMLKVWDKHYYYTKVGPYSHNDSPREDTYATSSVYLYKYILANEFYMRSLIYFTNLATASVYNFQDIAYHVNGSGQYIHAADTFLNTPDQTVSNVFAIPGATWPFNLLDFNLGIRPTSQYFQIAKGYPRNHYTHKMQTFSPKKFGQFVDLFDNTLYIKGQQTVDTTINVTGLTDGSYPVASNNVSNVNVVNTGNVLQFTSTTTAGTVIPNAIATNTSIATTGGTSGIAKKPLPRQSTPVGGNNGGDIRPPNIRR